MAAYDKPDATDADRHIVRIARSWLRLMKSRHAVQGIVNRIMDELNAAEGEDYGCGWDDLKKKFFAWAIAEGWLEKNG